MKQILKNNITGKEALFAIAICIVFGTNSVAMKVMCKGIGPLTAAAIRFFLSGVFIFIWSILTGKSFKIFKENLLQLILYCFIFTTQMALMHKGISYTDASRYALIINLQPFFVLILAQFFIEDDKITLQKFVGIMIGLFGASLLFIDKKGTWSDIHLGDIIILLGVFIWGCNAIFIKKNSERFTSYNIVMYPAFVCSIVLFILGAKFDHPVFSNIQPAAIAAILYSSLIVTAFGFVAWTSLVQKYGTVGLHSFVFIMPVIGVLGGVLILDEIFTLKILTSMFFISIGILIVHIHFGHKKDMQNHRADRI